LNFIFQPLEELFASKLQKAIKITEAPDPARGFLPVEAEISVTKV
jgi:hypothetical protein